MVFWREAWLRKIEDAETARFQNGEGSASFSQAESDGREQLRARLKTSSGPKTYFCQASELLKATNQLSRWERFAKCFSEVRAWH
jgi:hypothetical protein